MMWVYEEVFNGKNLSEIINAEHENPKYLPGVKIPVTVRANTNIIETCKDADVIFFVIPHQFLKRTLKALHGHVKPSALGVSLIKGLEVNPTGPVLLSEMIREELCLTNPVAVVMGANVASDVAADDFVEVTVACQDLKVAEVIAGLWECSCVRTATCRDVTTVELCGALKNVVALGAGKIHDRII